MQIQVISNKVFTQNFTFLAIKSKPKNRVVTQFRTQFDKILKMTKICLHSPKEVTANSPNNISHLRRNIGLHPKTE